MKGLLGLVAIVGVVLILLGIFLKALKWLIIIGAIVLLISIVSGFVQGRRSPG